MPGLPGTVFRPEAARVIRTARFSPDRLYRYELHRVWDPAKQRVLFIGLNPSKANEIGDDNTVSKCIGYALQWGYGAMAMLNIFAYVATHPREMKHAADPVGAENDAALLKVADDPATGLIVCMWGTHASHRKRDTGVLKLLGPGRDLHCLAVTKDGYPSHTRMLRGDLKPMLYPRPVVTPTEPTPEPTHGQSD